MTLLIGTSRTRARALLHPGLQQLLRNGREMGALTFNGTTDRIDVGSDSSLDDLNVGTRLTWAIVTGGTGGRLSQKGTSGSGTGFRYWLFNSGPNRLDFATDRATLDQRIFVADSLLVTGRWFFAAVRYDLNGVDADQDMLFGSETVPARTADGTYTNKQVGSGALAASDAAANLILGNNANFNVAWQGLMAWQAFYNRRLSIEEIVQLQREPWLVLSGCVGSWFPGLDGPAGKTIDWSGRGNHGTPTGTSRSKGPSTLRSFRPRYPAAKRTSVAYTLACDQGSYSLAGQAVALKAARVLTMAQGSYVLSGQAVGLKAARALTMSVGSYVLAGQAVGLTKGPLPLVAAQGAYTLTGQAVTLRAAHQLALAQGAYVLAGQAVTLQASSSARTPVRINYPTDARRATVSADSRRARPDAAERLNEPVNAP